MIKWFDAAKFLPGRECGEVIARVINDNVVNKPLYYLAIHDFEGWQSDNGEWLEPGCSSRVTHWAHINEPYE